MVCTPPVAVALSARVISSLLVTSPARVMSVLPPNVSLPAVVLLIACAERVPAPASMVCTLPVAVASSSSVISSLLVTLPASMMSVLPPNVSLPAVVLLIACAERVPAPASMVCTPPVAVALSSSVMSSPLVTLPARVMSVLPPNVSLPTVVLLIAWAKRIPVPASNV